MLWSWIWEKYDHPIINFDVIFIFGYHNVFIFVWRQILCQLFLKKFYSKIIVITWWIDSWCSLHFFKHKLVYLVYSRKNVSFSQGGTGVPCTPFSESAAPLCCCHTALLLVGGGDGKVYLRESCVYGSGLIGGVLAYIPLEVEPCAIFPLEPLHTDPVHMHPGFSYTAVGGAHQSDHNPTLDVSAHLRVGLFPLGGQATG